MGTQTSMGFIPHMDHPIGFRMPVKLKRIKCEALGRYKLAYENKKPIPIIKGKKICYALPGGGEVFI